MTNETSTPSSAVGIRGHEFADFRRLFHVHVAALVITASVVVPLLLGVASIPFWVSLAYCSVIAVVALAFVVVAIYLIRSSTEPSIAQRIERLSVVVGLSVAQLVFVLPVLICICSPNFRL